MMPEVIHIVNWWRTDFGILRREQDFELLDSDQRGVTADYQGGLGLTLIGPLSLLSGKSSERPGAGKGARFVRGGGKSFPGLKRFCGADPCRRGPFWNMDVKGRGASAVFIVAPPRRAYDAFCAWIRLSTRCGKRCAPDGPGCCRRWWGRQSVRASAPRASAR